MSKSLSNDEHKNGLIRNYFEIISSYNSLNAYNDLADFINKENVYPNEFLAQCYFALFDNCLSHLVKVVVHHGKSYTFQNILNRDKKRIQSLLMQNKITIDFYKEMQKKLHQLRIKQLFHIDISYLDDPNKIWKEIQIKGDDFKLLITGLYNVLKKLYLDTIESKPKYIEYDDKSVLEYLEKNYPQIPRVQHVYHSYSRK